MLWSTLFNRIGKQPMRVTNHQHVYALVYDAKSHQYRKVWLCLKFDNAGRPYLVEDFARREKMEEQNKHR